MVRPCPAIIRVAEHRIVFSDKGRPWASNDAHYPLSGRSLYWLTDIRRPLLVNQDADRLCGADYLCEASPRVTFPGDAYTGAWFTRGRGLPLRPHPFADQRRTAPVVRSQPRFQ